MRMMAIEADQPGVSPTPPSVGPPSSRDSRALLPTGRLRDTSIPDSDRNMAIAVHVSPFAALLLMPALGPIGFIAPLIIWLVRKDTSPFLDDHGREVLNACLSCVIWCLALAITIVGIPLAVILVIVMMVNMIRGAVAANRSEYFRYPMTIRFFS